MNCVLFVGVCDVEENLDAFEDEASRRVVSDVVSVVLVSVFDVVNVIVKYVDCEW